MFCFNKGFGAFARNAYYKGGQCSPWRCICRESETSCEENQNRGQERREF